MSRWESVSPRKPGRWRAAPACYVIFYEGVAVYVGQSIDVQQRIRGYSFENYPSRGDDPADGFCTSPWGGLSWRDGTITAKVKYARRFGEQLMVEARLIRRIKPRFNIRGCC